MKRIKLFNFSHPITKEQIKQVKTHFKIPYLDLHEYMPHFDPSKPFLPQFFEFVEPLKDEIRNAIVSDDIVIFNLPGLSHIAALLALYFIPPLRKDVYFLRLKQEGLPPKWVVAELIPVNGLLNFQKGDKNALGRK